jgi:hypothetical protein
MTLDEQRKHFAEFTKKMAETMFKKGNDYAGADRLSNFKLAGSITGISGQLNCLNLIATKVARLGVLLHTNKVNYESVSDSLLDLANYAVLLDQLETDERQINKNSRKVK